LSLSLSLSLTLSLTHTHYTLYSLHTLTHTHYTLYSLHTLTHTHYTLYSLHTITHTHYTLYSLFPSLSLCLYPECLTRTHCGITVGQLAEGCGVRVEVWLPHHKMAASGTTSPRMQQHPTRCR